MAVSVPAKPAATAADIGVLASNLLLVDVLVSVSSLFGAAGIRCCAMKGGALLATVYRDDLGSRPMNDVDLLVAPGNAERAILLLRGRLGYRLIPDSGLEMEPPPGAPGHGVLRVDLHDRLHFGGRREAEALLSRVRYVTLGRGHICVPDPHDHLLQIVAHAVLHQLAWKPYQVRDVVLLAAECRPATLRQRAAAAGMLVPLALALETASRDGDASAVGALARCRSALPDSHGADRLWEHWLRRRLAAQLPPGRAHLWCALRFGSRSDFAAHLVRRAVLGPARAQLADAGVDPRHLA